MRHRGEAREKRIAQFEKIAQESSSPPPESSTWDEKYQRFELPTWDEQYQRFELLLRHDFHGEPRSAGELRFFPKLRPGVSPLTTKAEIPRDFSEPVRAITM